LPYILGFLIIAVQVICAVHALRTGRAYVWLWIILFFPFLGCLIYFIVEVLPGLQHSSTIKRVGSDLVTIVDPGRSLRQLEEQLEITDTVKNRQMLARGYLKAGRHGEAIELYQRCLSGPFKDDAALALELAYAYFLNGSYDEAAARLEALGEDKLGIRSRERNLLYARTLEQLGDIEEALQVYETVVKQASGEEARCRYAMLLERSGQPEKAREVYYEIVTRARRSPRYYRRQQKQWIDIARHNLGNGGK
jgi:hypothetical protein